MNITKLVVGLSIIAILVGGVNILSVNNQLTESSPLSAKVAALAVNSPNLYDETVHLSSSCINPVFDFYVFHIGTDIPSMSWTLADKVARTRTAFDETKQVWHDAWSAHSYSSVNFTANYYAVVPFDFNLSTIPAGVTPILIPQNQLPTVSMPYPATPNEFMAYFTRKNMKTELGSFWPDQWNNVVTRDPENGVGSLEGARKGFENIPVAVVDVVRVLGNKRGGWTNTQHGTIFLPYATNFYAGGFDDVHFNRTLAHELGHIMGLGEHNGAANWLMYNQGPGGYEIDRIEAERTRSIFCSPGLRPDAVGKVKQVVLYNSPPASCNDTILNRDAPLDEECLSSYSGSFPESDFMSKPITQFCALTEWNGVVLPEPIAVTDDPSSPNYFVNILSQYPGAAIRSCTNSCKCVPLMGNGGSSTCQLNSSGTLTCVKPTAPKRAVTTGGATSPVPANHCNNHTPGDAGAVGMCPADAFCPTNQKCAAVGNACRCIPKQVIHCGDGLVEGHEECEGPGSVCPGNFFCVDTGNGNAGMIAVCNSSCICEPIGGWPPTSKCEYQPSTNNP